MSMQTIPAVPNDALFFETNPLTNLIRGKKLRRRMHTYRIKMKIDKIVIPAGLDHYKAERIHLFVQHPEGLQDYILQGIIHDTSRAIEKHHRLPITFECETEKPLVFRSEILGVPYQHDENACRAWFAYLGLPWKANVKDLKEVAEQFGTTVEEMKEHKHCRRDRLDEETL